MESSESSEELSLLGACGEGEALDALGSVGSSSLDHLGGMVDSSLFALVHSVSLVVGLVDGGKSVFSSETLSGCGLGLVGSEANGAFLSVSLGRGVVESSCAHWIAGECLLSRNASLWLSDEAAVMFGQCP